MRFSQFTLLVPSKKSPGYWLATNTLMGSMAMISNEVKQAIEQGNTNHEEIDLLEKMRIVVQEELDEKAIFRYYLNRLKYSSHQVTAIVLTTYGCNMKCIYCYQQGGLVQRNAPPMSLEVADYSLEWIKKIISARDAAVGTISFYGGEPLLNLPAIEFIAGGIHEIVKAKRPRLLMSVVTNGLLLHPNVIDTLVNLGVTQIQTTLDGPPEMHDVKRPTANGKGTFFKIFDNIKYAVQKLRVIVSVNIDHSNFSSFDHLLDLLGTLPRKVILGMGAVFPPLYPETDISDMLIDSQESAHYLAILVEKALRRGFTISTGSKPLFKICSREGNSSFLIDSQGDIYKCVSGCGLTESQVGNVRTSSISDFERESAQHVARALWQNDECLSCVALPWCRGGCRFTALQEYGDVTKRICRKGSLEGDREMLLALFDKDVESTPYENVTAVTTLPGSER